VVDAKDTPGFIANRIGGFWLECALREAIEAGLAVEEADALLGRPMGIPKTGVFGLIDLVGLDLLPKVARSMAAHLPADDPFQAIHREHDLVKEMIAAGYTGRKGKGGFYRLNRVDGRRVKEARDLRTGAYRPAAEPRLGALQAAKQGGLRALFESPDRGGRFAWRVMSQTLAYAAALVPEIADSVDAVDEAMRLGYGWKKGPFELIDDLGPAWFAAKLEADGRPVPLLLQRVGDGTFYRTEEGALRAFSDTGRYLEVARRPGVLLLADIKRRSEPLARNGAASLWDIGDGVACLEFHTKMNAIDAEILALIERAIDIVAKDFKALVIHNEAPHFSVGANLGLALFAANVAAWPMIEDLVAQGQRTFRTLRHAPFPVVGAPSGMALGGGCEVLLHCDAVQAHAETYMGLVETGVGVVPAWGGCTTMLGRWLANPKRPGGPMPAIAKVFETLGLAKVAKSAAEAKDLLFLRPDDGITMNRDRVLADAKARALARGPGYRPPEPQPLTLPGPAARVALERMLNVR
jgi:3-hydroxyacyl-CoA dehydrogenase